MAPDQFFQAGGGRLLTAETFAVLLDGELQQAVRTKNFLTLVVIDAHWDDEGLAVRSEEGIVDAVASIVSREVRDTDLIGKTDQETLSLALLDADFESSTRVIDRLVSRIGGSGFPTPLRVSVGAASYPTHAVDVGSLAREARSHRLMIGATEPPVA